MSRNKSDKRIRCTPNFYLYKPQGVPLKKLKKTEISLEEYEALRLFNKEELNQTQGAEKMGISQSTFQRILCSARKKLALAILDGRAICIQKISSST